MLDTPASSTQNITWTRIITYGIVVIGILLNLLFIVPNGDYSCQQGVCGILIGEWHYHDAIWHIAVARNSFTSFPFVFPSAAGFALTSYNYLLGAILFLLEKVWISPFFTYFKLLPILGNIVLVYTLFRYYRLTKKTAIEQLWISFFMYIGSSFSFFLIFYRNDFADFSILKGFPVVATVQPAFVLSNVQFFLTLPIIIYIFTDILAKNNSRYSTFVHCILLTVSVGLKIYSGVFVFLLLLLGTVRRYWLGHQNRKAFLEILLYGSVFLVAAFIFFLPFSTQSKGLPFIWSPVSIPHVITESIGLFYHKDFTLGRYFMYGLHKLSPRLLLYEAISTSIFLLWNLGTRIIFLFGVLYACYTRRFKMENIILLIFGSLGIIIPVFFIQNGGGWYNTIQFAYLGVYFVGILAGIYVAKMWTSGHFVLKLLVILIVILTLPNNILMFKLLAMKQIVIPIAEIKALEFLGSQPQGVVLSFPDYKNSSYVPALSGQVGYMIDYEQARLISLPEIRIEQQIDDVEKRKCSVLDRIDYLYLNSSQGKEYTLCPLFKLRFKLIYKNSTISISRRM
jgi:hypothetical protein